MYREQLELQPGPHGPYHPGPVWAAKKLHYSPPRCSRRVEKLNQKQSGLRNGWGRGSLTTLKTRERRENLHTKRQDFPVIFPNSAPSMLAARVLHSLSPLQLPPPREDWGGFLPKTCPVVKIYTNADMWGSPTRIWALCQINHGEGYNKKPHIAGLTIWFLVPPS